MKVAIIKQVSTSLIVFLLFFACYNSANADYLAPTIVVSSEDAVAGEILSVSVDFRNSPGVAAVCLDISFDESVLSLESVSYGESFKANGEAISSTSSPVRLSWSALTEVAGSTTFATLVFAVSDSATADVSTDITVSYSEGNICNMNEDSLLFDCVNGHIEILSREVSPSYDINGDGILSASDLISFSRILSEISDGYKASNLDLNRDGSVNLLDLVCLMKVLSSVSK